MEMVPEVSRERQKTILTFKLTCRRTFQITYSPFRAYASVEDGQGDGVHLYNSHEGVVDQCNGICVTHILEVADAFK